MNKRFDLNKLKEMWHNPRGRAIILLCFYLFFIIFVVSGLNKNTDFETIEKTEEENIVEKEDNDSIEYKDYTNYEYEVNVTLNDITSTYIGKRNENKSLITDQNNNVYYLEDGVLYSVVNGEKSIYSNNIYDLDLTKLNPQMINSLIDVSTLNYTTNFANGNVDKNYILSLSAFMKLYFNSDVSSNEVLALTITSKDDVIKKVELDLTNYEKYRGNSVNNFKIVVSYNNLGGVPNINID